MGKTMNNSALSKMLDGWAFSRMYGGGGFFTSPSNLLTAEIEDGACILRRNILGAHVIYKETDAIVFVRKALRAEVRFRAAESRRGRILCAEPFAMVAAAARVIEAGRADKPCAPDDIAALAALVHTAIGHTPGGLETFARALLIAESDSYGLREANAKLSRAFAKR